MWLNICQGLVLVGWLLRLSMNVLRALKGVEKEAPTGAAGLILTVIWFGLNGVILWRSGAVSTILGVP